MDSLLVSREGAHATVTLSRPEKLNALDRSLWAAVGEAFRDLDRDDDLRCIVLRGAGGNFGAGADIAEFPTHRTGAEAARGYYAIMNETMAAISECRHPTVALIEGACVGGALELALCCDLRLASANARFGVPIQKIAVNMAYPELEVLIAAVGRANALEILLEGRVFPADEALHKGLINRVVPADKFEEEGLACARRIAAGAPLVHRFHKRAANVLLRGAPTFAERDEALATFASEDFKEGQTAFVAKRPPVFRGR